MQPTKLETLALPRAARRGPLTPHQRRVIARAVEAHGPPAVAAAVGCSTDTLRRALKGEPLGALTWRALDALCASLAPVRCTPAGESLGLEGTAA
jgi:hypothetical protein